MNEKIKLKCPLCGAILKVRAVRDIEKRNIPCPVCNSKSLFTEYKRVTETARVESDDSSTEIAGVMGVLTPKSDKIGYIVLMGSDKKYQLELGRNLIGRMASSSTANIQIDTTDRTMSRAHSIIEVIKLESSGKHIYHFFNSNNKNETFVNDQKVENDDKFVLNGGEKIKMGGVIISFLAF